MKEATSLLDIPKLTVHHKGRRTQKKNAMLNIRNLSVWYGEKEAVKKATLPIEDKGVTALIGPSGCGKSTFLRSINRMNDLIPQSHTQGEIIYEDVDILDDAINVNALRKEIGMVFQKPNPFAKSIYHNMTHALRFYGKKDKSEMGRLVETTLKQAALWDEVKDRLNESALSLSGGQQQRLCIARTLAMKPRILLLDEPASALDPISNAKIEELIVNLKRDLTIVIVTHNMQQAARVSDHTAFFLNGEIIEYDDTETIFTTPSQHETEAYITGRFG